MSNFNNFVFTSDLKSLLEQGQAHSMICKYLETWQCFGRLIVVTANYSE